MAVRRRIRTRRNISWIQSKTLNFWGNLMDIKGVKLIMIMMMTMMMMLMMNV